MPRPGKPPKPRPPSRLPPAATLLPGIGPTFNVRAAKANLSRLLDLVASGEELVLTADGKPRARLIPFKPKSKPFKVDWNHLRTMPMNTGPSATEIIRADRDIRGS